MRVHVRWELSVPRDRPPTGTTGVVTVGADGTAVLTDRQSARDSGSGASRRGSGGGRGSAPLARTKLTQTAFSRRSAVCVFEASGVPRFALQQRLRLSTLVCCVWAVGDCAARRLRPVSSE